MAESAAVRYPYRRDSRRARPLRPPSRARLGEARRQFREISEADALFFAGAALSALDSVAKTEPLWAGAWRARLALKSAAAVAQNLLARREDEAALRDAVALAKPGQDLGPAGKVYAAFRTLCGPGDPFRPKRLAAVAAELMTPLDPERAGELAATLQDAAGRGRPAPLVATAAAAAVTARPDAEPLALWVANAALARALAWPVPIALIANELFGRGLSGEGRRPRPGEPGWGKLVALAHARAALAALELAQDLSRRAEKLAEAAPRLRAKRKGGGRSRRCSATTPSPPRRRSRASPTATAGGCSSAWLRSGRRASSPAGRPSGSTGSETMARRPNQEPDFDRELSDLPPELRWREWEARVEAVLFAAAKPVTREVLARLVGRDCALEFLPISHLVFSNLKTWLNGIHHGVSAKHLQAYLNEFTFRFNRRFYPFNAFRSLLGIAGDATAPTYAQLYSGEWEHPRCSGGGS